MSREIKFRAWDTENKCFHQNMDGVGGYYYNFGVSTDDDVFVLQQYTGLKDRNGKEIYEGDIIASFNKDNQKVFIGVVEYRMASFWINGRAINMLYAADCNLLVGIDKKEIIGNIYENPELLK